MSKQDICFGWLDMHSKLSYCYAWTEEDLLTYCKSVCLLSILSILTLKSTRDHNNLHNLTFIWHLLLLQYWKLKASTHHQVHMMEMTFIRGRWNGTDFGGFWITVALTNWLKQSQQSFKTVENRKIHSNIRYQHTDSI